MTELLQFHDDCSFLLLSLVFLKDRCASCQVFDLISVLPEALPSSAVHRCTHCFPVKGKPSGVAAGPVVLLCECVGIQCEGLAMRNKKSSNGVTMIPKAQKL